MALLQNPQIQSIHVYPVKSLAGVEVQEWELDAWGLRGDRRYMLVDERGLFMSQRSHPAMAQFTVRWHAANWHVASDDGRSLELPVVPDSFDYTMKVKVWDSVFEAGHISEESDNFFTAVLGVTCKLVGVLPQSPRLEGDGIEKWKVAMSDASPLLIISVASLEALNGELRRTGNSPVGMQRFRPNIVLAGTEPFIEDRTSTIIWGNTTLKYIKRCSRCVMINLNEEGHFDSEPLRTLATFRREAGKVFFGAHYRAVEWGRVNTGKT